MLVDKMQERCLHVDCWRLGRMFLVSTRSPTSCRYSMLLCSRDVITLSTVRIYERLRCYNPIARWNCRGSFTTRSTTTSKDTCLSVADFLEDAQHFTCSSQCRGIHGSWL